MALARPLIAGNWKMNGLGAAVAQALEVAAALQAEPAHARVAICPPATLVERMARAAAGSALIVGGQDIQPEVSGPHTGDLSAEMLADAGARLVILGHSERRAAYAETDALVARKVKAALRGGLEPVVCVGETLEARDAGRALEVICTHVVGSLPPELEAGQAFAVAYEPIWAIGSGRTPSLSQIEAAHAALRRAMATRLGDAGRSAPILYGGSVTAANAAEILGAEDVGGALVGGASLKAETFLPIVRAAG